MASQDSTFPDRIVINSLLITLCFVGVLALSSQSAASYPAYFLALSMIFTVTRWNDVFRVRFFWFMVVFLIYLATSSAWSVDATASDSLSISIRVLLVLLFVVAVAECQLRGIVEVWLGRSLAAVGAIAAVAAIYVHETTYTGSSRLAGLGQLDNPVVAGLVFGAVLVLLVEMFGAEKDKLWRWLAVAGLVCCALAVYMSGSRNAWIATLLGVLTVLGTRHIADRYRFAIMLASVAVMLAVAILAVWLGDGWADVLFPRGDSHRLEIWSNVISATTADSAVFGRGILTSDDTLIGEILFLHPHSVYLSVFHQGGLVALTLFLALTIWTMLVLFNNYQARSAKIGLGLLVMASASYLFDGHELVDKVGDTWFLYWLPVGISLGFCWTRRLRGDYGTD